MPTCLLACELLLICERADFLGKEYEYLLTTLAWRSAKSGPISCFFGYTVPATKLGLYGCIMIFEAVPLGIISLLPLRATRGDILLFLNVFCALLMILFYGASLRGELRRF